MFEGRRFRCTSTDSLKAWLALFEAMPAVWPFLDTRIAIRNELWRRDREEAIDAWLLAAVEAIQ